MNKISRIALLLVLVFWSAQAILKVEGYKGLAQHHCQQYPLDLVLRMCTGQLAEIYGPHYVDYDSYIRQFVGKDNTDNPVFQHFEQEDQSADEQDSEKGQYQAKQQKQKLPQIDPIVSEYVEGLQLCGLNWTPADVYQIWRFVRFVVQNDYLYEWLRAKMRISFGYEIQKPSSWMDGELKEQRLRLEKLYSNDYLDDLETDFFRDYLFPLMTAIKKNTVVALSGRFLKSKQPVLINIVQTRNFMPKIFSQVEMKLTDPQRSVFAFTLPGLPLLISGSASGQISWAFSGILVDRTNVEVLQTTGMKYFDQETERWIKVKNITSVIKVKDGEDIPHNFYWSEHGPFVNKLQLKQKIKQFIIKWHEDEPAVRNVFSKLHTLIATNGETPIANFQSPFNSIVYVNRNGIHQIICPPEHTSYFIYPDLMGEPRTTRTLVGSNPKKGFYAISNQHLSSIKPDGYLDREIFSPQEQALSDIIRRWKEHSTKTLDEALKAVQSSNIDSNIKKLGELFLFVYRKAKFTYFPQESIRKQCDQLVSQLDNWDYTLTGSKPATIFRLWLYYTKLYTFNHVTRSPLAKYLARFRATTNSYYAGQIALWKQITSYGECDSHEYRLIEAAVNHTGHNCTCYYSIFRALNSTRLDIKQRGSLMQADYDKFKKQVNWDLVNGQHKQDYQYIMDDIDEAFGNSYATSMVFASEIGGEVLYSTNGRSLEGWQGRGSIQDEGTDL